MTWIIVLGLLIIIVIIFIYWGRQPNYYRNQTFSDFERFFEGLITSGGDGCLLFIKHQGSNRFIQFAKYVSDRSHTTINFGFPDAEWSRNFFKPLYVAFDKQGIDYRVQGTGDPSDLVPRFIEVDRKVDEAKKTSEELAKIAKIAFGVMGIDEMQTFRIHFEGAFNIKSVRGKRDAGDPHMGNDGE